MAHSPFHSPRIPEIVIEKKRSRSRRLTVQTIEWQNGNVRFQQLRGLAVGWGAIVMETFEMERRNWFRLRDQPQYQGRRRRQRRHSGRKVPLEPAVVEALSVLDL